MIEKYNTLSLAQLKAIVKAQGIKNTSAMRKAQLVQILSDLEEQSNTGTAEGSGAPETGHEKTVPQAQALQEASSPEEKAVREEKTAPEEKPAVSEKIEHEARPASGTSEGSSAAHSRTVRPPRPAGRAVRTSLPSSANRSTHADSRSEQRFESRGEYRNDQRFEGRSEYRSEQRFEGRSDQRFEGRGEYHGDLSDNSRVDNSYHIEPSLEELDSGNMANGILEVMQDGFGFIRCENYLPGDNDIYVSPAQIRRFNLKTGDIIEGNIKIKLPTEKFSALLFVRAVNGFHPSEATRRPNFEDMTPIFPNSRIRLETERASVPMRIVDLVSPIGKGQRGMIVAPPKTGKTTLLKQIAKSVHSNHPDMNMIILLIDERPEEVTDIKEYIEGDNVEVIYSTFDELPEHHKRVSEMVLERAKRLVEHKKDVIILLDSITRLARAYNLTVPPSGRTLSGGLDPAALHMPKKFFGAARNMREGGSLTVLATALVETGSKMDDVVFEEFKGTGNMELVLDRKLSEKRIFPAIDIARSGTRREELLLSKDELETAYMMRKALGGMKSDEALERILEMFMRTRSNKDFITAIKRTKFL